MFTALDKEFLSFIIFFFFICYWAILRSINGGQFIRQLLHLRGLFAINLIDKIGSIFHKCEHLGSFLSLCCSCIAFCYCSRSFWLLRLIFIEIEVLLFLFFFFHFDFFNFTRLRVALIQLLIFLNFFYHRRSALYGSLKTLALILDVLQALCKLFRKAPNENDAII